MCMRYVLSHCCTDSPSFLSVQVPEMQFEHLWSDAKHGMLVQPFAAIRNVLYGNTATDTADVAIRMYRSLKAWEIIRCIESAQHWFVLLQCLPRTNNDKQDPFMQVLVRQLLRGLTKLCIHDTLFCRP